MLSRIFNVLNFKLITKCVVLCHIDLLALKFISPPVIYAKLLRAAFVENCTTVFIIKEVMKK